MSKACLFDYTKIFENSILFDTRNDQVFIIKHSYTNLLLFFFEVAAPNL